jgi:hypothetical protein
MTGQDRSMSIGGHVTKLSGYVPALPTPIKFASLCGVMLPKVRLPLTEISEDAHCLLSDAPERLVDDFPDALIENVSSTGVNCKSPWLQLRETGLRLSNCQ